MNSTKSYFKPHIPYKERYHQESLINQYQEHEVLLRLLDSGLISQTNKKFINIKVIDCNTYKHVFEYKNLRHVSEKLVKCKDPKVLPYSSVNKSYKNTSELKEISIENISRTKNNFQRLIQCNINKFKTFITLTFKDNVTDVSYANKKFNTWRTKVKSIYPDFAYICVPEFQKRGAVHYHLLTNLDIKENSNIITLQANAINKYDVKYWSYGFTSAFTVDNINVVGYMSKYMTKDIDNRLFSKRRYLYSSNLEKPVEYNLDLSNLEDFNTFCLLFKDEYNLTYFRDYEDFYGETVKYKEFVLKTNIIV